MKSLIDMQNQTARANFAAERVVKNLKGLVEVTINGLLDDSGQKLIESQDDIKLVLNRFKERSDKDIKAQLHEACGEMIKAADTLNVARSEVMILKEWFSRKRTDLENAARGQEIKLQ